MARKDKLSNRERELARYMHMEQYIQLFLKNYSRPNRRWPGMEQALEEVGAARLLLAADLESEYPSGIRRGKLAGA